jgi:hypothetical protein
MSLAVPICLAYLVLTGLAVAGRILAAWMPAE